MLPATALGRGSRKEPLQPEGFLLSHTLWAEGSKSSGREGGRRTGQSLISICFHNIFNSFLYLTFSKILSLLDFTFLSFRPGTCLGRGNFFESQLLTGMFYHCLSRQMGAYYYYCRTMCTTYTILQVDYGASIAPFYNRMVLFSTNMTL